ncbi:MAG: CoA activase, partial [candidate division Zixibacteria bacterium]|nr:CoA activase [candidate division Zixibacteria bacterium]
HCGLEAEVLPESDAHTLEEGRKYTSGRECFPAILTTGDLMKMVKSEGFDKKRSAFFMPTADGPCRFGQYHSLHRKILDELGYDEVAIYSPSSRDSYTKFIAGQGDFRKVAWSAFVTVDLLIKMLHHCRPYEIESGRCQKIYDSALNELNNYLVKDKELLPFLEKCAREFIAVEKTDKSRPLVGVVGEIYIRNNRFANNHLISKLEKHGCEVYLATIGEWVLYTTFMYKRTSTQSGDIKSIVKSKLQEYVQYSKEHQLSKVLKLFPGILKELPVDEVLDLAKKYISISIGGEAILSIGKGIDLINSGASGIINAMPFTCMPGNIVTALSKSVLSDYPDFPWLNVSYEGLEDTGEEIRLEAFVHQVSEYSKRNIK